jgi:hypothetical protein
MNREQAIEKAAEFYAKPRTFIGALEALGVLKLDAPAPAGAAGLGYARPAVTGWGMNRAPAAGPATPAGPGPCRPRAQKGGSAG